MNNIYEIDKEIPPIATMPNDNKLRVVWAYGSIHKYVNKSFIPDIEVGTREILPNGSLSRDQKIIKTPFTGTNIIRLMTIWRGNRRTTAIWDKFNNYKDSILFSIDAAKSISKPFLEIDALKEKYQLGFLSDKKFLYHFAHSAYTELHTDNNTIVYIPSIELFTSTFVPKEASIKVDLLQENIETILSRYIQKAKIKNGVYHIMLKEEKLVENAIFLAYAKFNSATIKRLKLLRSSLERQSDFPDRYPIVLPYHPEKMEISGNGIWINNKIFLMFRINGYSLPDEYKVMFYDLETEFNQNKPTDKEYIQNHIEIEEEDIPINDNETPHIKNASKHITSEVTILNKDNCNVEHKKLKKEINDNELNISNENKENLDAISFAKPNQKTQSTNVGKIKFYTSDDNQISQTNFLNKVLQSLRFHIEQKTNFSSIKNNNIYLKDIKFINQYSNFSEKNIRTTFYSTLKRKDQREIPPWIKKKKRKDGKLVFYGYRQYLLVKLILSNDKQAYLLEIDRKDNERFLGLIFNTNGSLACKDLFKILNKIVENKGVVKKVKISGMNNTDFKHSEKDVNLHHCIQRGLKKGIRKSIFL